MGEDITERFDPIEVTEKGEQGMRAVRECFKEAVRYLQMFSAPNRAQSIAFTEMESASRAAMRAIAEANRK